MLGLGESVPLHTNAYSARPDAGMAHVAVAVAIAGSLGRSLEGKAHC